MAESEDSAHDPSTPRVNLQLSRAPQEGSVIVRTMSVVHGVLLHRPRDKDQPCPGPDLCSKGTHAGRSTWKGYLAALVWGEKPAGLWKPAVFEVSSQLASQMTYAEGMGEEWEVLRGTGKSGHREIIGRFRSPYPCTVFKALPWIVPVLYKIFKTTSIKIDVENPFLSPPGLALLDDAPPDGFEPATLKPTPMDPETWRRLRAANGFPMTTKEGKPR
jgi:hypothetical protein